MRVLGLHTAAITAFSGSTLALHYHGEPCLGPSAYTVPANFPTSAFSSYYVPPSSTQEPQPILHDPVLNITYPRNLTDPAKLPSVDNDPVSYPRPITNMSTAAAASLVQAAIADISSIILANNGVDHCSKCQSALAVAQIVAQTSPSSVPDMLVTLCKRFHFSSDAACTENYAATRFGAIWTQVLNFADVTGLDGRYICNELNGKYCPAPSISPLDTSKLFPKPKPKNAKAPMASGKRVKVLHLSDFHLDPRYAVASEANCTAGLCCRTNVHASGLTLPHIELPAPLYGAYQCDTPYYLALAALQSIAPLTGTSHDSPFAWTIYTGDLISHEPQNQLSREYVEYAEYSIYQMLKEYIASPVFAVLGNHDSNPEGAAAPHSEPDGLGQQFSWNYDHVAGLWLHNGWIDPQAAQDARLHYGAYSIKNHYGLRIITLNTDFWYRWNYLNYYNMSNPDVSGMQAFLIQELQAAEDAGERVWILGHVPTGFDGSDPLPNPSNLFYQIVDRYSPHVIANVFFGHTHDDQFMVYYANNASDISSANALMTGWIGPSVTPMKDLNSGFRMYEVDTGSFEVYEAYTWYADVSSFPGLSATGPTFKLEYSTRASYNIGWPASAPLNATYWHAVTEAMESDMSLVSKFNTFQGKSSVRTPKCVSKACAQSKICYMRSGSFALGQACLQG
ncbi:MAG: hypothetical protein Q9191_008074 [Dirinaria sp. TL-2023a]